MPGSPWAGWTSGFSLISPRTWIKISGKAEREAYVKHAIELIGCFYMRCTDHLPLIPDIGNYLFGGSSSDQAITLGGVTPEGGRRRQ
jgi:hypothetical protein